MGKQRPKKWDNMNMVPTAMNVIEQASTTLHTYRRKNQYKGSAGNQLKKDLHIIKMQVYW